MKNFEHIKYTYKHRKIVMRLAEKYFKDNSEVLEQVRKRDDVGLIDGLLRLISPEKYEMYRKNADELYYKYEY